MIEPVVHKRALTDHNQAREDLGYWLQRPPRERIANLITSISGVSWEEVEQGQASGEYGDVPVRFIERSEFVENKRATGRIRDRADLEALGEE